MLHTLTPERRGNRSLLDSQAARESNARSYPRRLPLAIQRAEGIHVTDMDGKTYYDCLAGAGTLALGHNHPVVVDAIRAMLDQKVPLHTLDLTTPLKEAFVDELFASLPAAFAEQARVHFCAPTGADAVEAAVKLAKIATGRSGVFSFHGGYHGSTHATMSLSGSLHQKSDIPGLMPEVQFLPYPYAYRCPFGVGGEQCQQLSAHYLRNLLGDPESGVRRPAAIILEVVQGEGGAIPAPVEWLREVRRITEEYGIVLIIDEVQTGFGRTGKLYAFEHAGIVPDILVLSKAIGGSLPLSVLVYRERFDVWKPGAHIGTFRGNQMAMAAGLASLRHIRRENLPEQAAQRGRQLMDRLAALQRGTPEIGEVRGRGLMIGVEIVDGDGATDTLGHPLANPALASAIQRRCFQNGLILELGGRHSSVVRFLPPLIISAAEVDAVADIFAAAVRAELHAAGTATANIGAAA
ncbi:diaminobutyrate--2-oxoglutarate transaminase [Duganella radicis]|uniref:Diaminobutyrate--2-oxoglutarate transaminase n=1 Tax=Duganella radicis TaxID=551988 RepID=A0A6L6PCH2_9BURK|nr:diaminobutyrate--2-oxoglutarate transaminase [Duganella radicis]MTV36744.1 diaminobutyrate--2-oxoglutarate transaminase family protein [Duganella radicis]